MKKLKPITNDVFKRLVNGMFCLSLVFIFIVIIFLLGTFTDGTKVEDLACYEYHISECEECHKQNKTFALCSGFCIEPKESQLYDLPNGANLENVCAIHPLEDCNKSIPKECLI